MIMRKMDATTKNSVLYLGFTVYDKLEIWNCLTVYYHVEIQNNYFPKKKKKKNKMGCMTHQLQYIYNKVGLSLS